MKALQNVKELKRNVIDKLITIHGSIEELMDTTSFLAAKNRRTNKKLKASTVVDSEKDSR